MSSRKKVSKKQKKKLKKYIDSELKDGSRSIIIDDDDDVIGAVLSKYTKNGWHCEVLEGKMGFPSVKVIKFY